MQTAVAASLLAGNALALLGAFLLLRRVSFSGLAVSQLAALGTVAGAIIGTHEAGGYVLALLCVVAGMLLFDRLSRGGRVPEDAWVACLYILSAGTAVLALSKSAGGETHTMTLFFGNVLGLGGTEVLEAGLLAAATAALLLPWLHRWIWLFFDPLSAEVAGVRVRLWNGLFIGLFAAGMTLSIHLFGVLLAFAYLILPGMAALLLSGSLRGFLLLVPALTTGAVLLGVDLSFRWDFPTGPFVSALLAAAAAAAGAWRALARGR